MMPLNFGTIADSVISLPEMQEYVHSMEMSSDSLAIPIRFNFLRNVTVEGIEPYLKYHCYASGLKPKITFGDYGTIRQEILDKTSHLYATSPDIVVVSLFLETHLPNYFQSDWRAASVINDLQELFSSIAANTNSIIAINTFVPPFFTDFGIANTALSTNRYYEVLQLNQLLRSFVQANPGRFVLIDWERLLRLLGEGESMDYRFWYMSKAPFKPRFLNLYALELVKIAKALKGKSKKCLVLDCDNTLWGGIVGEDGIQGIKLDRHAYPGVVYYAFQQRVLNLHERGVLIVLCSKNNEDDVWEILDKHPSCLLKRTHLSAWRLNWEDKVTNIQSLAHDLNLGLESFVFVDDNPSECEVVKSMIPEVTVLRVPPRLHRYPSLLDQDGLFDTLTLSTEDRQRSEMYRAEATRKHEQAKYENIDDFLGSLNLSVIIHQAKPDEVPRIAQLTQKTNQFNLTTRRYSESQITSFCDAPDWAVLSLSVRDKFGDYGLTGVLIAKRETDSGTIDSLLLSCRILSKRIEVALVLQGLDLLEQKWPVKSWYAEYIPTNKNHQVEKFWQQMGFSELSNDNGHARYRLVSGAPRHRPISFITIQEKRDEAEGA
ncbi:MAG: HAD-IIIC family phosphatase [Ignavibacteriales bacterium]|nr:HAD-IIIC family phosphatase [Ignavibacteriales bacterium]